MLLAVFSLPFYVFRVQLPLWGGGGQLCPFALSRMGLGYRWTQTRYQFVYRHPFTQPPPPPTSPLCFFPHFVSSSPLLLLLLLILLLLLLLLYFVVVVIAIIINNTNYDSKSLASWIINAWQRFFQLLDISKFQLHRGPLYFVFFLPSGSIN